MHPEKPQWQKQRNDFIQVKAGKPGSLSVAAYKNMSNFIGSYTKEGKTPSLS